MLSLIQLLGGGAVGMINQCSVNYHDGYDDRGYERRSFLTKPASIVGLATVAPTIAIAKESSPATATPPLDSNSFAPGNYDSLLDLPPMLGSRFQGRSITQRKRERASAKTGIGSFEVEGL